MFGTSVTFLCYTRVSLHSNGLINMHVCNKKLIFPCWNKIIPAATNKALVGVRDRQTDRQTPRQTDRHYL